MITIRKIRAAMLVISVAVLAQGVQLWSQGLPSDAAFDQQLSYANAGNVSAELLVAKSYLYGAAGVLSNQLALNWFQKAADQGSLEAKSWVGLMNVEGRGVPVNREAGLHMLNEDATAGDPTAMALLGMMYCSKSSPVPLDYEKATAYLTRAINLNDGAAAETLGSMYASGQGFARDNAMAAKYYVVSARLGDSWGELRLGDFYAKGIQVPQDINMAVKLYKDSASQGNKLADLRMAELYENGTVVPQDLHFARIYYVRSVLQGYPTAELAFALFLSRPGMYHDPVQAYVWTRMAVKHNVAGAAAQYATLRRQMTLPDLRQAEIYLKNMPEFVQQFAKGTD